MTELRLIDHDVEDRFDPDPGKSYTLRGYYYTAPEVYEREKEAVFYRSWNYVGHLSQIPEVGSYFEFRIADQNLFVIRGKDEAVRAFYNVCPHRAHELVKGAGKKRVITCPYHAWSFHADGRFRSARGSEKVEGFDGSEFCLTEVRTEVLGGFIFANLDAKAAPLADRTPGLEDEMRHYCPELDDLRLACRLTYDIKANWKNVCDNYLECYHCPPSHPAFVDLVDIASYRVKTYDIHSSHIGRPGRPDNAAYKFEPAEGDGNNFAGWWIWPNVTFNTFPGPGNMGILHIMPTGPETTFEHFDYYTVGGKLAKCDDDAIEYFDKVLQVEDIGLVESVQRGLKSRGYEQGRFIVDRERTEMSEHGVHHFHNLVLGALKG